MDLGKNFFKVLNFAIMVFRLIAEVFGDDDMKAEVAESKKRTASPSENELC